ncbi:MAG: hypothetical protein PHW79_06790 [Candidatus Marinimicrobia bacterium]|nr:hypothetical protein [Candidatus Neomarinimicrobiota bacterium]
MKILKKNLSHKILNIALGFIVMGNAAVSQEKPDSLINIGVKSTQQTVPQEKILIAQSEKIYKNMVFLGANHSQFTTTGGIGKTGINFGYYRQSRIWKHFYLNYGIMYTNKKLDLINKKIRWSDVHYYSERTDIHLNYNILELNLLGSYSFHLTENIFINPVIGIGCGIFFHPKSKIGASKLIYQNEPVEDYDYRMAFTDGPPIIFNSGQVNHFGLEVTIKRYFGMLIYSNYSKILSSAGIGDLILDEKINSFNGVLGVYF